MEKLAHKKTNGPIPPDYVKPYREFQKKVKVGDMVRVFVARVIRDKDTGIGGKWVVEEREAQLTRKLTNCFYLQGYWYATPWFSVVDWEIEGLETREDDDSDKGQL